MNVYIKQMLRAVSDCIVSYRIVSYRIAPDRSILKMYRSSIVPLNMDKVLHNAQNEADSSVIAFGIWVFFYKRSAKEARRAFNPDSAVHDRLLSESTSPLKTSPYLSSHYCCEGMGVIMCEIGLDVV